MCPIAQSKLDFLLYRLENIFCFSLVASIFMALIEYLTAILKEISSNRMMNRCYILIFDGAIESIFSLVPYVRRQIRQTVNCTSFMRWVCISFSGLVQVVSNKSSQSLECKSFSRGSSTFKLEIYRIQQCFIDWLIVFFTGERNRCLEILTWRSNSCVPGSRWTHPGSNATTQSCCFTFKRAGGILVNRKDKLKIEHLSWNKL